MKVLKSILLSILIVWAISYSLSCLITHELLNPTKIITDWIEWVPAWFVYLAVYYWPSKKMKETSGYKYRVRISGPAGVVWCKSEEVAKSDAYKQQTKYINKIKLENEK